MKRRTSDLFIKLAATCMLILGFLIAIGVVVAMLVFSFTMKDLNSSKLIMIDFVAFIIAVAVFLTFFGIYEFLISFIRVEKEIDQIEDGVKNKGAQWRDNNDE